MNDAKQEIKYRPMFYLCIQKHLYGSLSKWLIVYTIEIVAWDWIFVNVEYTLNYNLLLMQQQAGA